MPKIQRCVKSIFSLILRRNNKKIQTTLRTFISKTLLMKSSRSRTLNFMHKYSSMVHRVLYRMVITSHTNETTSSFTCTILEEQDFIPFNVIVKVFYFLNIYHTL